MTDPKVTRRGFLQASTATAVGLAAAVPGQAAVPVPAGQRCILLNMVGGPSQLDTWDPKPGAPSDIRGPFKAIRTAVPGTMLSECFPLMAARTDRFALVRSLHHDEAPIHETGQQLLQTGRRCPDGAEQPHFGAVVSRLTGGSPFPPHWIVPGPIGSLGVSVSRGQSSAYLGAAHEGYCVQPDPITGRHDLARLTLPPALGQIGGAERQSLLAAIDARQALPGDAMGIWRRQVANLFDLDQETLATRRRFGDHPFGRSCLLARRLIEAGARVVTVNMFDSVFDRLSWDCHADGGSLATTLHDYAETLCPQFDMAFAGLLDDLGERGLLSSTLIVATGEFGRSPKINPRGGRDHWTGVWSAALAGGGVAGGRVIGASDRHAAEPRDRPVKLPELTATIYRSLGIDLATRLPQPDGRVLPVASAPAIDELF